MLHSNKIWESLKKNDVVIDEDYNSFYLKLNNPTLLNKYDAFHIFIYINCHYFSLLKSIAQSLLAGKFKWLETPSKYILPLPSENGDSELQVPPITFAV